jgi:hypothetical protein
MLGSGRIKRNYSLPKVLHFNTNSVTFINKGSTAFPVNADVY